MTATLYGARLRRSPGQNRSSWIRGRQLGFLIDYPEDAATAVLEIELAFEPWMTGASFSVRINGGRAWHSGLVSGDMTDGKFRTWSVPVSVGQLRQGPDFVSVLFDQAYPEPGGDEEVAAARVRAIRASVSD